MAVGVVDGVGDGVGVGVGPTTVIDLSCAVTDRGVPSGSERRAVEKCRVYAPAVSPSMVMVARLQLPLTGVLGACRLAA